MVEYITEDQTPWCPEHDGAVRSSAIMSFDKSWVHNFSGTSDNHDRNTWYGYKTTYGYFEMRAKLANCGGGGHQAWWLVGMQQDTDDWFHSTQTGEIDILETFFSRSNTWRIAAYGWNDPNFQTSWGGSENAVPSGDPAEEFHIYAVDWTPKCLKFYYDNQLHMTIYDAPNYDMGMILNIYTDAGSGTHNDVWPKEWAVDYIRVWKSNEGCAAGIAGRCELAGHPQGCPALLYKENHQHSWWFQKALAMPRKNIQQWKAGEAWLPLLESSLDETRHKNYIIHEVIMQIGDKFNCHIIPQTISIVVGQAMQAKEI